MTKIIQRHDTAANWAAVNPVLAAGEMGVETDTSRFKFGNGTSTWTDLAYATSGSGGSGTALTSADGATTYSELALGDTLSVTDTRIKELNKLTQTGGTLNSELEFTGASGAYLKMTEKYNLNAANSWEFQIKYKHKGGGSYPTIFGYASGSDYKCPTFLIENGKLKLYMSSNGSSWNLNGDASGLAPTAGTIYFFKVGFTGSQYYIKYNTTGWSDEFTTQWILNSTTKVYCSDYFMLMNLSLNSGYYNTGTMYLQDTALIINGSEVWRGAKVIPGPITLNANLDELSNEVNTLANTKQDKFNAGSGLEFIQPRVSNFTQNGGVLDTNNIYKCYDSSTGTYGQLTSKELIDYSTLSSYEIRLKFEYQASPNSKLKYIFEAPSSFLFGYWNSAMQVCVYPVNNYYQMSIPFVAGHIYYVKLTFTGSIYSLSYNGTGWEGSFSTLWSTSSTTKVNPTTGVTVFGGKNNSNNYLPGGLYVEDSSYILNGTKYPLLQDGPSMLTLSSNKATTSSLGVVQPDGTSITVNEAGVISGQDVKTFTGYSDTGTLVLKSINGVLQWVTEG